LWQAQHVAELLRRAFPAVEVSLLQMSTEGDRFLQTRLSAIGGKGLFVKEIEQALLDHRADLAVHSLKDMTSSLPAELCLAAVPPREDPRDAWVSPSGVAFSELPRGSSVGTSSLRRACQILERRPDLHILSLRGNVQTRLQKTAEQKLAGTVLALAGLRRLGLEAQVTQVLEPEVSLPAIGQGVLAIECRSDDRELRQMLQALEDRATRVAVAAERSLLAGLEGGCTVPLAGYATLRQDELHLRGLVGRPDGTLVVRGERTGPAASAQEMGRALAQELLERGGRGILAALDPSGPVPEA
jgi:hydroxymethylbilane synthase